MGEPLSASGFAAKVSARYSGFGDLMTKTALISLACATALAAFATSASAAGNAGRGKTAFSTCQVCHSVVKGGASGLGPNLFGVAGRKAASVPGFYYSVALKNSKITWTNDKLTAWITSPSKLVPGNRMAFPGIGDQAKVADIIAYLDTLH
jgi:cytochrome c